MVPCLILFISINDDGSQKIGGTSGITKSPNGQVTNVRGKGGITIFNSSTPATPASAASAKANADAIKDSVGKKNFTSTAKSGASPGKNSTSAAGINLGGVAASNSSNAAAASVLGTIFGPGAATGSGADVLTALFGKERRDMNLAWIVRAKRTPVDYHAVSSSSTSSLTTTENRDVQTERNLARTIETVNEIHIPTGLDSKTEIDVLKETNERIRDLQASYTDPGL